MRVVIVSQYYPPENVPIPHALAHGLSRRGHHVRVLTGYPSYPEGRLYEGYSQRWRERVSDQEIELLRVPLYVNHSTNAALRSISYASFGISAATARKFTKNADVVYVYAPQMTPAFGPWLWQLMGGAPFILHVQDLWPDSITGSSMVGAGRRANVVAALLNPWLRSVYKHSAAVIGIAPTMVKNLTERGVDSRKVHLVYNWAEEASLYADSRGSSQSLDQGREGARILFGGNIGDMQDLETVVKAAYRVADEGVKLSIVGDGVALPRVRALAEDLSTTNVEFIGRVPVEQMRDLYREADFSLITLRNLPNFRGTIPSKFQASLAHGLPVIANVQGDVRNMIEDLDIGFTAEAEDVQSLETAFRRAAALNESERREMAQRARKAYVHQFSQDEGVSAIERILVAVAHGRYERNSKTRHRRRAKNVFD